MKKQEILTLLKTLAKKRGIDDYYLDLSINVFLNKNLGRILEYGLFRQSIDKTYLKGMEYQDIADEIIINPSSLSFAINEKRIPTLDNLKRYNERLKKL